MVKDELNKSQWELEACGQERLSDAQGASGSPCRKLQEVHVGNFRKSRKLQEV
jgi:hypothetical protein